MIYAELDFIVINLMLFEATDPILRNIPTHNSKQYRLLKCK